MKGPSSGEENGRAGEEEDLWSVFIYQACKIFIMSVYTHILQKLTVKVKRKKGQHTTNKRRQQNRD